MSYDVKRIPLIWIPMRDGVKLAAKIWLPEPGNAADDNASCKDSKYPAILEFLPYRRTDWTAQRDERHYFYFCSHGYGCVRVDMRGSGDSEGFFFDEYVPQEQQDCCDVISWISCQNWCTGNVGMFGKSWGGFNGLQLAALQVQELKTVISTYSSDDRYGDDVHYRGGCVIGSAMLSWAHRMFLWNARPPHPQSLGTRWKDVWLERLQKSSEPWIHKWLSHQTRDSYWKHGSICEDYDSIKCPVLLIGGFCDLYTDPVFRMVEHLTCPVKALIGPWPHEWPAIAKPGPQIDHMKECLRWWDCHLKGLSTGIMEEPNIRVYLKDGISQAIKEEVWPGKWIAEDRWPSSNVQQQEYTLQGSGGLALASEDQKHHVPGVQSNSTSVSAVRVKSSFLSGLWGGVPLVFELDELPVDQRFEDVLTACWETPTLQTSVALFGFPEVHLLLSSDKPGALIAARLCDVFPDGESAIITKGVLNLTHRKGHSSDTIHPLQPHEIFQIQFKLDSTAYTVSAGHKIRLALSSMYWPLVWPSPQVSCLSIQTGSQSKLLLPVRLPSKEAKERDAQLKEFDSRPQNRNALPVEWHREPRKTRKLEIDQLADVYTLTITNDSGCVLLKDTSTVYDESNTEVYTIEESTPASAKVTIHGQVTLREEKTAEQDDRVEVWDTEVQASSEMWADEEFFHLRSSLKAWHCTDVCFEKTWTKKIDRFFV